jgi:hypothetical protein
MWRDQALWFISVIPATQEAEIRRIIVLCQAGRKVTETPSYQISQAWWHIPVIQAVQEL